MIKKPHWGPVRAGGKNLRLHTNIDSERIDSRIFIQKLYDDILIKRPVAVCIIDREEQKQQ